MSTYNPPSCSTCYSKLFEESSLLVFHEQTKCDRNIRSPHRILIADRPLLRRFAFEPRCIPREYEFAECEKGERGRGGGSYRAGSKQTRTRQCVNRVRLMENGMACPVGMPARPQKPFQRTTMLARLLRYACMPGLVSFRCAQQYTRHRKTLRKNHSPRKVAE